MQCKKSKNSNNYAFIDAQNLYMGMQRLGWKVDYIRFRKYLKEKYNVSVAYMFLGYILENKKLYKFLENCGYILIFRETVVVAEHKIKGNVDVDLTVKVFEEIDNCNRVIVVTSDGDFYPLINYLYKKNKLRIVISTRRDNCSRLLKNSAKERIDFIDDSRRKLGLKNRRPPIKDKTLMREPPLGT